MIGNTESSLEFTVYKGWYGLTTINDIWLDLLVKKYINWDEFDRVRELSHEEQQKELEKYPKFKIK